MSYILDALRKAEKDRNLGRTPSLGDVTSGSVRAPAASGGPTRRTLALIALVLGMLVLAILLWPSPPVSVPVAVVPAPAPVPEAPIAPVVAAAAPVESSTLPEANPVDPTLGSDVAAGSIDDLMDDSAEAAADMDGAPVDESVAASPPAQVRPAKPAAAAAEPVAPPEPVAEQMPDVAEAAAGDIPLLRDMPSDYRGAFPELRVDVHVYDDDPARRWALINGKKAIEGSTLAEGPTISEITPDGIVFDFRGQTALFPLKH